MVGIRFNLCVSRGVKHRLREPIFFDAERLFMGLPSDCRDPAVWVTVAGDVSRELGGCGGVETAGGSAAGEEEPQCGTGERHGCGVVVEVM